MTEEADEATNVVDFPANGHRNPNAELLLQPDAYALVQLVDGNLITSYSTNNLVELLGMIEMLRDDLLQVWKKNHG